MTGAIYYYFFVGFPPDRLILNEISVFIQSGRLCFRGILFSHHKNTKSTKNCC